MNIEGTNMWLVGKMSIFNIPIFSKFFLDMLMNLSTLVSEVKSKSI